MKKLFLLLILSLTVYSLSAQSPVYFEPSALEATVAMNDSVVVHSVLHNASMDNVEFTFPGYNSKDLGGPDDFGYTWIDSEEPGGPDWSWTDISETGLQVEGLGDDEVAGPFEMDFDFPFYGQNKNQFWISPNGVICFNDPFVSYANHPIPTNNDYADFIAWFWDDLKIDTSISRVYFKNFEEKTVVQFTKMVHYPGTESFITGQVIMMANGSIFLKYRIVSEAFETTSASVGIQSFNPELGLQVVYNAEYIHSELAVRFDLHRNFITNVSPSTLMLPPGTQETIWITYSSVGFESGSYEQDLKCITSQPYVPYLLLHNVMHVTNANAAGFKGYVTDAVTGYAINDALVQVGEHQTYTNDNGFYELPLEQGSYNVHFTREGYQPRIVEDTTAMPGYSILSVTLEPNDPTYFLVGRVYAGDNFLETGFAYGYKMIEGEVEDVYAEMVGEEGWYEFTGLSAANYILKAEPSFNSIYYGAYLPTYYGDVIHWEDATEIQLTQNTDGAHIHLVAAVSAPQGPGSISGTIENSSRTDKVPVFLCTAEPGVANMTMSNTDGSFAFTNLAFGTYEIFAEIPGKSIVPMTIDLNETNPSFENVDMLVVGNEIVFLGIEESEVFEAMPYLYPNPAHDWIHVMISMKKPDQVRIDLLDATGRLVLSESYAVSGQEVLDINVNDLSQGVYFMKMTA
ncbi:MAG: T9SS type A sorting domain-containing protein, partial [Bacteroidales bacterium]|nr:T9SS type A sorting domain-containing protein [Bacteroidales bacterium]